MWDLKPNYGKFKFYSAKNVDKYIEYILNYKVTGTFEKIFREGFSLFSQMNMPFKWGNTYKGYIYNIFECVVRYVVLLPKFMEIDVH